MVKKGYKQTEVGVIPEDWEVMTMNSLTSLMTNGFVGTIKNEYVPSGTGVLYLQGFNVKENNFDLTGVTYISKEFHKKHLKSELRELDLLTVQTGNIGVTAYLPKEFEGANCQALIISRFQDDYDSRFWSYYFNSIGRKSLFLIETGSTMKHINVGDMKYVVVPVPTNKKEQKCIAEALSDVDSMISSLEKLIAKKKAVKQGAMQELLTGKKRLDGFGEEWNNFRIGDIGDFYSGLSGKSKKDFDCGKAHFITFLNVLSNIKIDTSILARVNVKSNESQNAVQKGDLFFNTSSETPEEVGMCAVLDEDLKDTYLNSFCFGFRLFDDTHSPLFLSYYLNSSIGRKIMGTLAQGATRYNLSKNNFADTIVFLPSKEEQIAIASILSDMDNEIEALEQKLAKTRQIKQGMMQQLLTGKIRLVSEEKTTAAIPQPSKLIYHIQNQDTISNLTMQL